MPLTPPLLATPAEEPFPEVGEFDSCFPFPFAELRASPGVIERLIVSALAGECDGATLAERWALGAGVIARRSRPGVPFAEAEAEEVPAAGV